MKSFYILYVIAALLLLTLVGIIHTYCFSYLLASLALGFCLPPISKINIVILLFLTFLLVFSGHSIQETHHKIEKTNAWFQSNSQRLETTEGE